MNGIKTGLGITPGEHIISADSALSRNIRHCFCLSCHGRLILQTDAQGAWFEHDLHALSDQQKSDCVVLNPEKSHPYIADMAMFLSPLPIVLEWHCVMCDKFFPGKKFCLRRENQCGRCEHVITLKSDKSSVGLSHDCS
ncbi:putative zinc ribbon protein, partial [Escherichia coli]|uniref:putative zinc ribbon protein n=1 Tax=Escherichia coli TaxID=562 RepID=UPI003EDF5F13